VQKCAEEAKAKTFAVDTCFFFERNKTHLVLETNWTKF